MTASIPYNEEGPRPHVAAASIILIIDDEREIASMAQEILEAGNYQVMVEVNPVHGIEVYRTHRTTIGAVLLDLTMPEMSGKEVVDVLKEITPEVKIIISSGYSEEEVIKKIGIGNVAAFIQKPYRMQSLLNTVDKVMKRTDAQGK